MAARGIPGGDVDVSQVAALFADRTRARVLTALADGRALPASVLAAEAGVTAQAASAQLARLLSAGLISVERSGRHRYYRIAGSQVAAVLEALARISPTEPVRSLRQGTRAAALRAARTCYDHLAGRLGVQVLQGLLDRGALIATDGVGTPRRRAGDRLSQQLRTHPYRLGPTAADVFGALGVPDARLAPAPGGRPLLRACLDWSEQQHHLAGRLGADLLAGLLGHGWLIRSPGRRAVRLTPAGTAGLSSILGVSAGLSRSEPARRA
ncbi:transcriptional regulator [Actinocatenispora thailandica]|uniref:Transcriptional regulator n=1 Tax=Actinocatenispora thailandica TaxID=227318 RepID=A0A7R7DKQ8_9ACTN|nr:helix-turn-helix transcriptional regulator [Actinocatenispora thailandica]BCJ33535.1 transcriptional regulator [Actinocatenispora thailandica]